MKKIAVIGYGGQGAWHCDRISGSDVCRLAGTYDIKEERNNAARTKGIRVYDSPAEIFGDKEVDAVVIATPNDVHDELAVMNALGNPRPLTVTGTATDFFGKTPEAYAAVGKPECAEKFSVDDFASAYIRLEGGIVIDFRIAWYMHVDTSGDTIIYGTKSALRIPSTECWNGTFTKPMTLYHDVAGKPVQTEIPLIDSSKEPSLWDKKIRSFLNAIITGGKAPVPTNEIIYNQAILDGISRSSKLGREVEIVIPEV